MRLNVRAEFVAAKKCVAAEKRVTLALKEEIARQPLHFIAVFFHPLREKRRFAGAFFVAAGDRGRMVRILSVRASDWCSSCEAPPG